MKFKVGDHVKRVSENGKCVIDAEVVKVELDDYDGELDILICPLRFADGSIEEIGNKHWESSSDFDYAYSGLVASFMINGEKYTNEQYIKDCERFVRAFPHDKTIEIQHAIEDVLNVYQWAHQHPVITNLDHYAEEFGWTEDQKSHFKGTCPFPYRGPGYVHCPKESSGMPEMCRKCREWWKREWKGAKP